jgi:hypothetical protein
MDARQIFIASEHYASITNWQDWVYCGISQDFNSEKVQEFLSTRLSSPTLYIALSRHDSKQITFEDALNTIKEHIGLSEFFVWENDFTKGFRFDRIGVFCFGTSQIKRQ